MIVTDLEHLNDETKKILDKTLAKRIDWACEPHFVYLELPKKCINRLGWVYMRAGQIQKRDYAEDLDGLTIIGLTGTGKTSTFRHFTKLKIPEFENVDRTNNEIIPIGYANLKSGATGMKGLYSSLLQAYNHPLSNGNVTKWKKITVDQLEEALIRSLRDTGTIMFFIDEFQHVLGRNQDAILEQLKHTMDFAKIPFIPMGTPKVLDVLRADNQLMSRCPITTFSHLHNLTNRKEFRDFLRGYEKFLPFPEPIGLGDPEIAKKIFPKVRIPKEELLESYKEYGAIKPPINAKVPQTNLRNTARYLMMVSTIALRRKHNYIRMEDIEDVNYY